MNFNDKESNIIESFQLIDNKDIIIEPWYSMKARKIKNAIRNEKKWKAKGWIDSSGKNELPPDFYCNGLKLMMDVMRVDDHTKILPNGKAINMTNKRESEIQKELKQLYGDELPSKIYINAVTDLDSNEDHNYQRYIDSFERVINKHIEKIGEYKRNHEGHKIIFFIMDESSCYMEPVNEADVVRGPVYGERCKGRPHYQFADKRFIDIFSNSEIDYVIWYAPYKYFETSGLPELPLACVYDVKKIKKKKYLSYKEDWLISLED